MYRNPAKRLSAFIVSAAAALLLLPAAALFGAAKVEQKAAPRFTPKIHFPVRSAANGPLRDHIIRPQRGSGQTEMLFHPPQVKSTTPGRPTDPATIQRTTHGRLMPDPIVNFEGVGDVNGVEPADTTMAVGPNHVVQWVNLSFEVFDKSGNDLSGGPIAGNALWASLGGACGTFNGGDIIVHYDYLADRWFFAQLAYPSDFHNCIAVTDTGDPLGPFHAWDYLYSSTALNDYPKWGVWPDAYFGTFRDFAGGSFFDGMSIWALDRAAALAGDLSPAVIEVPAGVVDPNLDGLLPSDLSGGSLGPARPTGVTTLPNVLAGIGSPAYDGSPNAMVHLYQFHPDFVAPASSTFTGPVNLDVADFDFNVNVVGPSGSSMESLPFPLYRVDYRNFGDHSAIVFNHTVNVGGGQAGVRWYEIRDPHGSPTLNQQGTFAPDASHRWFGSAAIDVSGDISVGFSVTDSVINPSIRYAGRLVSDPPGDLSQGENEIIAGSFPFFGGRWGDYSTIVVDSTDQCTFWYTTMYTPSSAGGDWGTRIGSFKFPSCSAGPTGTLEGTVTDGTNPLAGAHVTAGLTSTTTNASGHYSFILPVANSPYNMTASKYGFFPAFANGVVVTDGGDTVQDFVLSPAPSTVVNGTVKDGSGGGWPLYAKIVVTGPGAPTFTLYTDPVTGYYSLTLVQGITYTFAITSPGYLPGGGSLPLVPETLVENWTLTVDANACTAPGYVPDLHGLSESFDAGVVPPDWTVINNSSGGSGFPTEWIVVSGSDPCGDYSGNLTGGTGPFAVANSDCPGPSTQMDTTLITPSVDMSSLSSAVIRFNEDYFNLGDTADVDISTNGGTNWTNVLSQTSDHRGPRQVLIDITALAAGQANVKARFHYYNAFWAWWWQVDNVLLGQAGCLPGSGGLVVGNVRDTNTGLGLNGATVQNIGGGSTTTFATPLDPNQDDGLYVLFAESGAQSFEASKNLYSSQTKSTLVVPNSAVRLDFSLAAGRLTASPSPINSRVDPGGTDEKTLNLTNSGTASADFTILEINAPALTSVTHGFVSEAARQQALGRLPTEKGRPVTDALSTRDIPPLPNAPAPGRTLTAGDVVASYPSGIVYGWGVATNGVNFWLSNLGVAGGDNKDYQYSSADGTKTGATIDDSPGIQAWAGDGAYDVRTGMMWRVDVVNSGSSCIFELDPVNKVVTGNRICPSTGTSERGLAYDPAGDTFFMGSWNDGVIWHFDTAGNILDSAFVGIPISGLAYNPNNGHLLVMQNYGGGGNDITVLDAFNNYAVIGGYPITDGGSEAITPYGGAGIEFDCLGNLWVIDQNTQTVYNVETGEAVFCSLDIPWLTETPTSGTVPGLARPNGSTNPFPIALDFDSTGLLPGLRQAQLNIQTDTPYSVPTVPVTLTVRFLDVPDSNIFEAYIYGAAGAGVMFGGPPNCGTDAYHFCPNGIVTRADMAGYIFRAVHGANTPPPVYQNIFGDVLFNDYNSFYIQGIFNDGITAGCGNGNYCPNSPNTRAQMSVFIWKGQHGSTAPPACTGVFADVACPGGFAVDYIEGLFNEGVTVGCGAGNFCPDANITNGQMAVFLVKGFNIPHL